MENIAWNKGLIEVAGYTPIEFMPAQIGVTVETLSKKPLRPFDRVRGRGKFLATAFVVLGDDIAVMGRQRAAPPSFYGFTDRPACAAFGGAKSSFGHTVNQLFHYTALSIRSVQMSITNHPQIAKG
jgi:hypothetical protein